VAGKAQREQDRGDLLVPQRLRILVVDLQQRAREVVAAIGRRGRHELAQVAAVEHHLLRVMQRLLGRRPSPGQARAAAAPLLQPRPVRRRHAHEAEHDPHRQRERQRADEIEWARRVDGVQELRRRRPDPRRHLVHPPRRERPGRRLAQPPVLRRVEADHRRLGLVPAVQQRLAHLGRERDQRQLRVGGAERLRIEEHPLDVRIARDDVVVQRRRVEHRLRRQWQLRHHRVRIAQERLAQRIEVGVDGTTGGGRAHHAS
jgi:hypothetical protein